MKKISLFIAALVMFSTTANAENIIVLGQDGIVKQQIYTSSPNIITTQYPQVSVVREVPQINNTYYYDNISTGEVIAAGITTAVVGALLFDKFDGHHHHHKPSFSHPKRHNGGHSNKHHNKPRKKR